MYIDISKKQKQKKKKQQLCFASFGRFISYYYGTELAPLFPHLRAGLLEKGGGG